MKLVMFTPIARASAIGRVASLVTRELTSQGHAVSVVRTELDEPVDVHRFGCDVMCWTQTEPVVRTALVADICVYQIGDHYPFHAGSLHWMPHLPGVVCLHDHFVGHLFDAWAKTNNRDPFAVVRAWYGDPIADRVGRSPVVDLDLAERAQIAPMTEWISSQGVGVLTHSEWVLERILRSCPGPVGWSPLPYERRRVGVEPSPSLPGRFRLLTVGHMNSNKRVASVIRAIGSDSMLRERVVYTLVGAIDPDAADNLRKLAESEGVELVVLGQVGDNVLAGAMAETHAVAALRWPCLEAASASAIEAMAAAKPVLVTRAGFYDELPDDCVLKIDVEREVDDVRENLLRLVEQPAARAEIGERARAYATAEHRADRYAEALVELARDALAVAPHLDVVRHVVETLGRWGLVDDLGDQFIFGPLRSIWGAPRPVQVPTPT